MSGEWAEKGDIVNTASAPGPMPVPPTEETGTAPVLNSLSPSSVVLGSPSFTLYVNGQYFTANSKIVWNGSEESTVYIDPAVVTTVVNMDTASVPVTVSVEVKNGDMTSNSLPFVFEPAARTGSPASRRTSPHA